MDHKHDLLQAEHPSPSSGSASSTRTGKAKYPQEPLSNKNLNEGAAEHVTKLGAHSPKQAGKSRGSNGACVSHHLLNVGGESSSTGLSNKEASSTSRLNVSPEEKPTAVEGWGEGRRWLREKGQDKEAMVRHQLIQKANGNNVTSHAVLHVVQCTLL